MMRSMPKSQVGFTLIEMIIVIVITGIIGSMVAMFIRAPVQGYVDSARRAEMSDIADNALRRIARDVQTAVPNSLRIPVQADSSYFEFLPTKDGGRYRVADVGAGGCGTGNELDFTMADTCFEIVGPPVTFAQNDQIVIGSTQSDGNLPYQLESASGVRRAISAAGAGTSLSFVKINSLVKLPDFAELEGHRFSVVPVDQQAVTYACIGPMTTDANGDAQGSLNRYWQYGYIPDPTKAIPPTFAGQATVPLVSVLASNVSDCHFVYDVSNVRNSLLAIRLTITRGGESVYLYHEIHVNNIP
jgi:MSHA biogenesis protein MshO